MSHFEPAPGLEVSFRRDASRAHIVIVLKSTTLSASFAAEHLPDARAWIGKLRTVVRAPFNLGMPKDTVDSISKALDWLLNMAV